MEELDYTCKISDDVTICIVMPNLRVKNRAETIKTKAWFKAVEDGAMLAEKMDDFLKEQGVWDVEVEAEVKLLNQERENALNVLRRGGCTLEEAREAALKAFDLREKILQKTSKKMSYAGMTVEGRAANAEFDYLVSQCVVYNNEKDTLYFKSHEDYLNRKNNTDAIMAANKFSEIYYDLGDIDLTEEKEFLLKYKMVDEEFNLINDKGQKVDRKYNLVDDDGRPYKIVRKKKVYLDEEEKIEFTPFVDKKGNPIELDSE